MSRAAVDGTSTDPRETSLFFVAGTSSYRLPDTYKTLTAVEDSLHTVVRALRHVGGVPGIQGDGTDFLLDITAGQFHDGIRSIRDGASVGVVYYTGHGVKPDDMPYVAATADSDPDQFPDTAILPSTVPSRLNRPNATSSEQPEVLVIFDCCFSGNAGVDVLGSQLANEGNSRVWTIASASESEYAVDGRFASALEEALTHPRVGRATEFIPLVSVIDHVNELLARQGRQTAALFPPRGAYRANPSFFRNPEYEPGLQGLTVDDQEHWLARLRGGAARTQSYLSGRRGRRAAVDAIADWMSGGTDLAVLTGSPGTGKSTIAALPVMASAPAGRGFLESTGERGGSEMAAHASAALPSEVPVHGIHVRGLTVDEVTARVAVALGRHEHTLSALLQAAATSALDHLGRHVLVLDGADEAPDPAGVVTFAEALAGIGDLKVLLVVRPHLIRSIRFEHTVIDLDAPEYQDPDALADYARALLLAAHEPDVATIYRDDPHTTAVAQTIAARASSAGAGDRRAESFLIAQLVARSVRAMSETIPESDDMTAALPSIVDAFEDEFSRLEDFAAPARHLLTALAWSKGQGLPWEQVWLPVAQAIAEHHGDFETVLDHDSIRMLLDRCGSFVVEDGSPSESSVFRPFHDTLIQVLQRRPVSTGQDDPTYLKWSRYARGVENAIARALLDTVPSADGARDWRVAHWYVRRHLADHAVADDVLFGELLRDLDFLATAEPTRLGRLLLSAGRSTPVELAYRRARPLLEADEDVANRKGYVLEALVATGAGVAGFVPGQIPTSYGTVISSVRRDDSLRLTPLYGIGAAPAALRHAVVEGSTDVVMAALGTISAMVQFDDDGGFTGFWPLTPVLTDPKALAFGSSASSQLELYAVDGARVLCYDNRGELNGEWPLVGVDDPTALAAFRRDDGSPVIALGTASGRILGLEPNGEGLEVTELFDELGPVIALALARDATSDVVVALGSTSSSRAFVLKDESAPLEWTTDSSPAVALELAGQTGLIVFADGSMIHVAMISAGEASSEKALGLSGHARPPSALASVAFDGVHRLVSLDADAIRYWDLVTAGPPHSGTDVRGVTTVAYGRAPSGRVVVVAGCSDGSIRFWNPLTGQEEGAPFLSHVGGVLSVATGGVEDERFILSSIGQDGDGRSWFGDESAVWPERLDLAGGVPSIYWADRPEHGPVRVSIIADRYETRDSHGQLVAEVSLGTHCRAISTAGAVGFVSRSEVAVVRYGGAEASVALDFDNGSPPPAAIASDGDQGFVLAVAQERSIRLFDDQGERSLRLDSSGAVKTMEFVHLDDRLVLFSAEWNGNVRAWDVQTGSLLWSILRREVPDALAVTPARAFAPELPANFVILTLGGPEGLVAMTVGV
jgi:hypothetical protein